MPPTPLGDPRRHIRATPLKDRLPAADREDDAAFDEPGLNKSLHSRIKARGVKRALMPSSAPRSARADYFYGAGMAEQSRLHGSDSEPDSDVGLPAHGKPVSHHQAAAVLGSLHTAPVTRLGVNPGAGVGAGTGAGPGAGAGAGAAPRKARRAAAPTAAPPASVEDEFAEFGWSEDSQAEAAGTVDVDSLPTRSEKADLRELLPKYDPVVSVLRTRTDEFDEATGFSKNAFLVERYALHRVVLDGKSHFPNPCPRVCVCLCLWLCVSLSVILIFCHSDVLSLYLSLSLSLLSLSFCLCVWFVRVVVQRQRDVGVGHAFVFVQGVPPVAAKVRGKPVRCSILPTRHSTRALCELTRFRL